MRTSSASPARSSSPVVSGGASSARPAASSTPAGSTTQRRPQREGREVGLDRRAVELDGPLDGRGRQRDGTGLEGHAEQEDVGRHGRAEQARGEGAGVDVAVEAGAAALVELGEVGEQGHCGGVGLAHHPPGRGERRGRRPPRWPPGRDRPGWPASPTSSRSKPSSTSTVPGRASPIVVVDTTGPAFWLRPVWSTARAGRPSILAAAPSSWLTVTTPVPPMPGMRIVAPAAGHDERRLGQRLAVGESAIGRRPPAGLGRLHGHEGRAVALHAAHVEVAAGLVDDGLAAELGARRSAG